MFEAVARLGGMSRAAEELHTVQSNVTTRIRRLEDELGQPLFWRHRRGVTLTPAGRRLLPYALRMAALLEDARRAVADDGEPKGELLLGSLETTAALRLSPVLADYVTAYPRVDLVLTTGTTCELVDAVLRRDLAGALVCGPISHPELEEEPVFDEELVVVTARSTAALDRLLANPNLKMVVLRAGCSYRERLEAILAARGRANLRRLEFGTIEGILSCVAAGLGLTLLPAAVVRVAGYRDRVSLHPLPENEGRVQTVFVRRQDAFVSSALGAFLELTRARNIRQIDAAE